MAFLAYEVSIELIRELKPSVAVLRRHDRKLTDQLLRAASSVALNVAEGNRRRGRDRKHHFRIAAGSADEVKAVLDVSRAWDYLSANDVAGPLRLVDRLQRLLWGLRGD